MPVKSGKFDSLTAEMLTASLQTISATARKLIELIDEPAGAETIHRGITSTKRRGAGQGITCQRFAFLVAFFFGSTSPSDGN